MKNLFPPVFLVLLGACSLFSRNYSPDEYFNPKEKEAVLWMMIRYLGKAPEGVSATEKFSPNYDSTYLSQLKLITLEAWYRDGETYFFMVSKRTPNQEEHVATGGKLVFDDNGGLREYEEVFRTWKMVPDTLNQRSMVLFDKMVTGESLKQFETRYANGVKYIEFPDEYTYYDKEAREWKFRSN